MSKYDEIINTKWPPEKSSYPKMPLGLRAKIFLPFSALTGYDKALKRTLDVEIQDMEEKPGMIQFEDLNNEDFNF